MRVLRAGAQRFVGSTTVGAPSSSQPRGMLHLDSTGTGGRRYAPRDGAVAVRHAVELKNACVAPSMLLAERPSISSRARPRHGHQAVRAHSHRSTGGLGHHFVGEAHLQEQVRRRRIIPAVA